MRGYARLKISQLNISMRRCISLFPVLQKYVHNRYGFLDRADCVSQAVKMLFVPPITTADYMAGYYTLNIAEDKDGVCRSGNCLQLYTIEFRDVHILTFKTQESSYRPSILYFLFL